MGEYDDGRNADKWRAKEGRGRRKTDAGGRRSRARDDRWRDAAADTEERAHPREEEG